jgi:type I restriction enzyme, S subunit
MWETEKLGNICDVLDRLRKPITKRDRVSGRIPYYGATGIVDYIADYIFDERLVLVGEDGAKWDAGERTAFIINGKTWVNNHAHVLRPHADKVLHEWLAYYLTGIDVSAWVTGLTVPKLNQAQLRSIPIPLPPLSEQQRIVDKLDAAFAEIDAALDAQFSKIKKLEKLFGDTVDFELNRISSDCEPCTLSEMIDSVEYGTATKCSKQGLYPVLRMGNMQNGKFEFDDLVFLNDSEEVKKYTANVGDVFFNRTNSAVHVGKAAYFENDSESYLFAGYLIRVNYDSDKIDGKFLNYYLNAPSTRNYGYTVMSSSVNQSNINGTKLKAYPFYKVDIERQRAVRNKFEQIEQAVKYASEITNETATQYTSLKSAILAQELQSEAL